MIIWHPATINFYVNTNAKATCRAHRLQITNNSGAALAAFVGAFHERVSTEKPALVLEGEAASEAVPVSASARLAELRRFPFQGMPGSQSRVGI